jgi:hypothetical protein
MRRSVPRPSPAAAELGRALALLEMAEPDREHVFEHLRAATLLLVGADDVIGARDPRHCNERLSPKHLVLVSRL